MFIIFAFFISFVSSNDGSYNSFRNQIGYCKMQSYNTISRKTSNSVPMFMDGRIKFGVGISNMNVIEQNFNLCGACLNITNVDNFYTWNEQLNEYTYKKWPNKQSFLVMVFDNCEDKICTKDFLDFDIYNEFQPVEKGNPKNIKWNFVPCPIKNNEFIEYLICTSKSCNVNDKSDISINELIDVPVYFWSITFRNMRIPIKSASVYYINKNFQLHFENSWIWDYELYDLRKGINITFIDIENKVFNEIIKIPENLNIKNNGYNGGILINSKYQN